MIVPTRTVIIRDLIALFSFVFVAVGFWFCSSWLLSLYYEAATSGSLSSVFVSQIIGYGVPALVGFAAARYLTRRYLRADVRRESRYATMLPPTEATIRAIYRGLKGLLLVGYLLTAVFGVPAVHSSLERDVMAARVPAAASRDWSGEASRQRLRFRASIPLFPGVIVSYNEHLRAYTDCSWGGWQIHLWLGSDPREIARFTSWIT